MRNNEAITIERMGKGFMISTLEGEAEHIPCETKKNLFKILDRHFSEKRPKGSDSAYDMARELVEGTENIDPRGEAPFGAPGSGRVV